MTVPKGKVIPTPYGDMNALVLEQLRESYDTGDVLEMIEQLDTIRVRLEGVNGIRDDLIALHAMSHTVINGARLAVPPQETALWEAAEELVSEFSDFSRLFSEFSERLRPLSELMPLDNND
ncbi:hypothetical protein H8K38_03245 [Undibacterium sp. FT79W]|uniref:Tn3 family transposase post-transcriptional regulator TnpC n=1 Tax=Undibacterium sp. FT79W TaxID=2762296 RepID=UPI00164AA0E1|nr:Tn3 family transposase post-transcriptional regulator TnpC [Undibacterium sp. FT79W]MBC3876819.1 hypothetical protein [Undibacterium sp. FT79W]